MIFISSNLNDFSTNAVIDWLLYYNKPFFRINGDENNFDVIISDDTFIIHSKYSDKKLNIKDIESYWYRRCGVTLKNFTKGDSLKLENLKFKNMVNSHLKQELRVFRNYFYSNVENNIKKNKISSYFKNSLNKPLVLQLARKHKLKTPDFYLVNNKKTLHSLLNKYNTLIYKALGESVYDLIDNSFYISYTKRIDLNNIDSIPNSFPIAFIQEEKIKVYELRVIVVKKQIFSCAMFTQQNEGSIVDGRNSKESEIPIVPYKLPREIELNILNLMQDLSIEYGAIDLIYDNHGDYIFLEINPVGQFSAYGMRCNYEIEKKISEIL